MKYLLLILPMPLLFFLLEPEQCVELEPLVTWDGWVIPRRECGPLSDVDSSELELILNEEGNK